MNRTRRTIVVLLLALGLLTPTALVQPVSAAPVEASIVVTPIDVRPGHGCERTHTTHYTTTSTGYYRWVNTASYMSGLGKHNHWWRIDKWTYTDRWTWVKVGDKYCAHWYWYH